MRIIDWSSDVCSSVLAPPWACSISYQRWPSTAKPQVPELSEDTASHPSDTRAQNSRNQPIMRPTIIKPPTSDFPFATGRQHVSLPPCGLAAASKGGDSRSEEHTSELQSLMRTSYAVFCLKKKITTNASRTLTVT